MLTHKTEKRGCRAEVFRSIHGTPAENIEKVIELCGGISKLVNEDDVVIIKPNLQWWNQGAPNLASVKKLIDIIFSRPGGFSGEVVIAENNHRGNKPWEQGGWKNKFERNSDLFGVNNFTELSEILKNSYGDKVSVCYWVDINSGNKRVFSPEDGSGYVCCDGTGGVPLLSMDNGLQNEDRREVIMSYPIFKSDKGTIIDFKNGIWENGSYTGQPLKFFNCAALNHHSSFCGISGSVKNHLGVTDLSGGSNPANGGKLTGKYYNFHSFPFDWKKEGPVRGMLGSEIGLFFDTIRKPDLNIITAEWIGLISRTKLPAARTKAVLASTDPVALDYHAAKYLLYANSGIPKHNPDNENGPLHEDLRKCAQISDLVFDESYVSVITFDYRKKKLRQDHELAVYGDISWGRNLKIWLKYLSFRLNVV